MKDYSRRPGRGKGCPSHFLSAHSETLDSRLIFFRSPDICGHSLTFSPQNRPGETGGIFDNTPISSRFLPFRIACRSVEFASGPGSSMSGRSMIKKCYRGWEGASVIRHRPDFNAGNGNWRAGEIGRNRTSRYKLSKNATDTQGQSLGCLAMIQQLTCTDAKFHCP